MRLPGTVVALASAGMRCPQRGLRSRQGSGVHQVFVGWMTKARSFLRDRPFRRGPCRAGLHTVCVHMKSFLRFVRHEDDASHTSR